ncbi:MAG: oligosaccharide flippase family protein [Verrucomicrobiia bacterium]
MGTSIKAGVVARNAAANVLRGSAGALVAIVVPPFLTRSLSVEAFGIWGLVLQLSAYVCYLDLGIQIAVGRFVAHFEETKEFTRQDQMVSTALGVLTISAAVALLALAALTWQLPALFNEISPRLETDARLALILVGTSQAISLPCNVFNGIFIGLQRSEIPTSISICGKVAGGILIVAAAKSGLGLSGMAAGLAGTNVAAAIAQVWACRKIAPGIGVHISAISRDNAKELAGYCFSLSVWSFSMLLTAGFSTAIVGFLDYEALAYFTLALTLSNFVAGLQNAAFSALMPTAAALGARGDAERLGRMLLSSTRFGVILLLCSGIPFIISALPVLRAWAGPSYASPAAPLLQVLVAANIIRLTATPYAVLLIGTGQQRLVLVTPLVEGFTNLAVSLVAGLVLGAMGVALGGLVGAVVGVCCNFFYNMRRTTGVRFRIRQYLRNSLLKPLLIVSPLIPISFVASRLCSGSVLELALALLLPNLLLIPLIWWAGVDEQERSYLRMWFNEIGLFAGPSSTRR